MSQGKVVQIIGAVVDVEFPRDHMPKVYDALKMEEIGLTLEVQQQLGDGVVRSIAMGTTDGLRRGMPVSGTGAAISVPVGTKTAASLPRMAADFSYRAFTEGSSPYTSSPTGASAITFLIAADGFVTVSLRRSITSRPLSSPGILGLPWRPPGSAAASRAPPPRP